MILDDGGPAFGGKATAWKILGDDEKARQIREDLARQDDLKSLIISEEDSKRIEQLTLHLPSMSLRDWYAGQALSNPQTFDEAGGGTRESAAKYLGVEVKDYVPLRHFPRVIAKACYEYADALIARKRQTEKEES